MIHVRKISLVVCFAAFVVAIAAEDVGTTIAPGVGVVDEQGIGSDVTTAAFVCGSICGNEKKGLSQPDLVVEYNWNSRVPVCAGKSCESGTCSELERKLPTYETDEADCQSHQAGLQEAGCECSSGNSLLSWRWMATTTAAATATAAVGTLLL